MGVVSRWIWVQSMGVASGCGCNEVCRFPHAVHPHLSDPLWAEGCSDK